MKVDFFLFLDRFSLFSCCFSSFSCLSSFSSQFFSSNLLLLLNHVLFIDPKTIFGGTGNGANRYDGKLKDKHDHNTRSGLIYDLIQAIEEHVEGSNVVYESSGNEARMKE